jgi:DNA invertase Pin-like site-specific DNA recombinase
MHEGWQLIPDSYDDGGISGGSLDRPDLKRLLADIAAGRVDTVVAYKVDRLTRSLTDFAKLVDLWAIAIKLLHEVFECSSPQQKQAISPRKTDIWLWA